MVRLGARDIKQVVMKRVLSTALCSFGACWLVLQLSTAVAKETNAPSNEQHVNAAEQAEINRLSDEIRVLARRQVWSGVERKYKQVGALDGTVQSDVHLTAAYSARETGDLLEVYERLLRAATGKANKAVVDWLWDLDHNYGRVTLVADRRRTAKLSIRDMPLDPNRRTAVEAAILACKDEGEFNGLLPRGEYEFDGQEFKVEPGITVRVEVSPKMRRQGLVEPTIVYRELPSASGQ